jgi:hypothetical protein
VYRRRAFCPYCKELVIDKSLPEYKYEGPSISRTRRAI